MILHALTKDSTGQVIEWGEESVRDPEAGETAHTLSDATKDDHVLINATKPWYTKVAGGHFVAMDAAEKTAVDAETKDEDDANATGFFDLRVVEDIAKMPDPPPIENRTAKMVLVLGDPPKLAVSTGAKWALFDATQVVASLK
jgi:hypothetical protein